MTWEDEQIEMLIEAQEAGEYPADDAPDWFESGEPERCPYCTHYIDALEDGSYYCTECDRHIADADELAQEAHSMDAAQVYHEAQERWLR
jgi:hypothetical protein